MVLNSGSAKCLHFDLSGIGVADFTPAMLMLLTDDERAHCNSILNEDNRVTSLFSRILRRSLMMRLFGVSQDRLSFGVSPYGKPTITVSGVELPDGFDFNVSHSDRHLAFLVATSGQCGVDIEVWDRGLSPADLLVDGVFSRREVSFIQSGGSSGLQRRRFYQVWTLKEALLKARGDGLRGIESLDLFDALNGECLRSRFDRVTGQQNDSDWSAIGGSEVQGYLQETDCYSLACILRNGSEEPELQHFDAAGSLAFI